jgi:hypothetical protein
MALIAYMVLPVPNRHPELQEQLNGKHHGIFKKLSKNVHLASMNNVQIHFQLVGIHSVILGSKKVKSSCLLLTVNTLQFRCWTSNITFTNWAITTNTTCFYVNTFAFAASTHPTVGLYSSCEYSIHLEIYCYYT